MRKCRAMDIVLTLVDFILHLDRHIAELIADYGTWIYAILFTIIFVETGLVVMPFLPGDSLLFICGAFAARGDMNLWLLMGLLTTAAILGDAVNYSIGRYFGPKVFQWENSRFFNKRAFDKTHAFYEKHGGITIILARFLPFIRTFAPFVAGVAEMTRSKFVSYNVIGAVIWVGSLTVAGYLFGNIPWVEKNLTAIIIALIIIPGLPAVFAVINEWRASRKAKQSSGA
jgi:membrane-associated protein